MMTRRNKVRIDVDGNIENSVVDVDWDLVRTERDGLLLCTDLWYLKDRWDALSSTAKGKLNAFRKALRELPSTYETANEAYDNMPTYEEWMIAV